MSGDLSSSLVFVMCHLEQALRNPLCKVVSSDPNSLLMRGVVQWSEQQRAQGFAC